MADIGDLEGTHLPIEPMAQLKGNVERLYRSPKVMATAAREVHEAATILGFSGEALQDIASVYNHNAQMRNG